jgi:hypothetical protein
MHPIDHYTTIRRGQEELLRRAEYERMARKANRKRGTNQKTYQQFANWLGRHMGNGGQKLERFGTSRKPQPTASPHY